MPLLQKIFENKNTTSLYISAWQRARGGTTNGYERGWPGKRDGPWLSAFS